MSPWRFVKVQMNDDHEPVIYDGRYCYELGGRYQFTEEHAWLSFIFLTRTRTHHSQRL